MTSVETGTSMKPALEFHGTEKLLDNRPSNADSINDQTGSPEDFSGEAPRAKRCLLPANVVNGTEFERIQRNQKRETIVMEGREHGVVSIVDHSVER